MANEDFQTVETTTELGSVQLKVEHTALPSEKINDALVYGDLASPEAQAVLWTCRGLMPLL